MPFDLICKYGESEFFICFARVTRSGESIICKGFCDAVRFFGFSCECDGCSVVGSFFLFSSNSESSSSFRFRARFSGSHCSWVLLA